MTKQEESKIKDVCPDHGQITCAVVKQLPCGHEDYDMDIELNWCPICGKRLQDINGEKVDG